MGTKSIKHYQTPVFVPIQFEGLRFETSVHCSMFKNLCDNMNLKC